MRRELFAQAERGSLPLDGALFADVQRELARFNHRRFAPGLGTVPTAAEQTEARDLAQLEEAFVEAARAAVAPLLDGVPETPDAFLAWFEALRDTGPGQNDPLFPWLAETATREELRWFLLQEVAGEAGFDDLVALTQVKMPVRPKLEMARNYWDEMGRGQAKGMHGPMLERLAQHLDLAPTIEGSIPEALALGNMMAALAANRHYAFHAAGALGVIEMTAPARAAQVARGLDRLGIPAKASHYFLLHAVLDVKHSEAWNREVLHPLVAEDPRRARPLAEGALLRLWCGARCFGAYRQAFGLPAPGP